MKKEEKVVIKKFDNVTEFISYLRRPCNPIFSVRMSEMTDDPSWSGSATYEAADNLLKYGDKESLKRIQKASQKLQVSGGGYKTRRRVTTSVVGFVPHIPNYLQGKPDCMINIITERIKSPKVVNILYNRSVSADISAEEIAEAGAKILSYVASLESQGYRVNLHTLAIAKWDNEVHATIIRIKSSDQHLDPLKVAYPLVHASMHRRHIFRCREVSEELKSRGWADGYGCTIYDEGVARRYLKGLKYDHYFNIHSALKITI